MYAEYGRLTTFDEVKIGQLFVERSFGTATLYRRTPDGKDSDQTIFNCQAVSDDTAAPAYFRHDDLVFVFGQKNLEI